MSSTLVITIAVIVGIAWLGFILVAALRRRGPEEIPSNLAPGTTDDLMETRRLETGQKTAVLLSAFLAISLPLYFLGEQDRQVGFEEQFDEESVERGEALVEEFACYSCHGPEGVGGVASYVEKRSGVTVSWEAPSINDVFYRYDDDEVTYWLVYGRGNSPMPAWGLDGGGPMNDQQIQDMVNYLKTTQVPQMEAVAESEQGSQLLSAAADRLENGGDLAEQALISQQQVLADIDRAPEQAEFMVPLAEEAQQLLETAGEGIDTDGDGLSDAAETGIVEIGEQIVEFFQVVDPVTLDPQNPQSVEGQDDLTTATEIADEMTELVDSGAYPGLAGQAEAVQEALDTGTLGDADIAGSALETLQTTASDLEGEGLDLPASIDDAASAEAFVVALEEAAGAEGASEAVTTAAADARAALDGGLDPDEDGLASAAEQEISNQVQSAIDANLPAEAVVADLDPTNDMTSGEPDVDVANRVVSGYESLALNLNVTANNIESIRSGAEQGVAFLEQALEDSLWEIDVEGVAESTFDGDLERAERAVLLYQAFCARCHTSGYSAGVPYTLEAGSGGFGPALWNGRPTVQFGESPAEADDDLLVQFLINGSQAETPYGINGFGSGRMPAFGQILTPEDIELIAEYLRGGDLTGTGADEEVVPDA